MNRKIYVYFSIENLHKNVGEEKRVARETWSQEWNKNWSIVRKVIVSCVSRWLGCKWYLGQAPWSLSSSSSHVTLYLWLVEHEMKNEIPHGKFYQIYLNLCIIKLKKKNNFGRIIRFILLLYNFLNLNI